MYYSQELQKLEGTKNEYVRDLTDLINNTSKSDVFSVFSDFIKNYQNFLEGLSLEQIVALVNIIGYFMLITSITSISTLLLGEYLLSHLKLEVRYPKLAKYIKMKEKLNKGYLMYYIISLYIILILGISVNIYMFSLKYFV